MVTMCYFAVCVIVRLRESRRACCVSVLHYREGKQLRVAVGFYGVARGSLDVTLDSIRAALEPVESAGAGLDVFVSTYSNVTLTIPRSGEISQRLNDTEYTRLEPRRAWVEDDAEARAALAETVIRCNRNGDAWGRDHINTMALLLQLRSLWHLQALIASEEAAQSVTYDAWLLLRPDQGYHNHVNVTELLSSIQANAIYVPAFASWRGVSDRYAFGPGQIVSSWARRGEFVNAFLDDTGIPLHAETFVSWWMNHTHTKLCYSGLLASRVRATGKVEDERPWIGRGTPFAEPGRPPPRIKMRRREGDPVVGQCLYV